MQNRHCTQMKSGIALCPLLSKCLSPSRCLKSDEKMQPIVKRTDAKPITNQHSNENRWLNNSCLASLDKKKNAMLIKVYQQNKLYRNRDQQITVWIKFGDLLE